MRPFGLCIKLEGQVTGQGHRSSISCLELFVKLLHITCELYMLERCSFALKNCKIDKISWCYLN